MSLLHVLVIAYFLQTKYCRNTKCEKREIPEDRTFPLIWQDFVKDGHFLGRRTIHIGNTTVDVYVWALQYVSAQYNNNSWI